MSRYIGCDIGNAGALAIIDGDGSLCEVVDMPILRDGPKGRPSVNVSNRFQARPRYRVQFRPRGGVKNGVVKARVRS